MKVSPALHKEIVEYLLSLPGVSKDLCQKSWIPSAGLANRVVQQVNWNGPIDTVFSELVGLLAAYGKQENGQPALCAFLEVTSGSGGIEHQQALEGLLMKTQQASQPDFVFVNRQEEVDNILSSLHPPYCIIDAPAGYGKTELMRELRRRFTERGWVASLVSLETATSSHVEVVRALARGLSLRAQIDSAQPWISLIAALRTERLEEILQVGIVLLIDFKNPNETLVRELINEHIPRMHNSLRTLSSFDGGNRPFRVIVAGRHLAPIATTCQALKLGSYCLTPFSYHTVCSSTALHLKGTKQSVVRSVAAHLMHYTGGHPGCVAQVLSLYSRTGYLPDEFFTIYHDLIWDHIVKPEVEEVCSSLSEQLRQQLLALSTYRYLDPALLRKLAQKGILTSADPLDTADELTKAFLLDWEEHLLSDGVTRRLLDIYLRYQGTNDYLNLTKQAQLLYEEYLKEPYVQSPWRWAIEVLYQRLRQGVFCIQEPCNRLEMRRKFFKEDVPQVLSMLADRTGGADMIATLGRVLQKDWEFRFSLNYILREETSDTYTDDPALELDRFLESYSSK